MTDTITLPREVGELALDALEFYWGGQPMGPKKREAVTALRDALAAPKQEPVAWLWLKDGIPVNVGLSRGNADDPYWLDRGYSTAPLYTAPPDIEALRRDAERYRWMKQAVNRIPPGWGLVGWDAAIDAAMQEVPRQ